MLNNQTLAVIVEFWDEYAMSTPSSRSYGLAELKDRPKLFEETIRKNLNELFSRISLMINKVIIPDPINDPKQIIEHLRKVFLDIEKSYR